MISEWTVKGATQAIESGWAPDWATRMGIRYLCGKRKASISDKTIVETKTDEVNHTITLNSETIEFIKQCEQGPIAVSTDQANEQHYELPPEFFALYLGDRRKYSCCHWDENTKTLDQAEQKSLSQVCQRARIEDGMNVLELGCGWGAVSLWILEHFPNCRVTAVSNSSSQREHIENAAEKLGVSERLNVLTADMNSFETQSGQFDRVVSLEMFEHMRNHRALLQRVKAWLKEDGMAFIHVFCHKDRPYLFETNGASNWMGRYFFTGGMMPSFDLLAGFPDLFEVEERWKVNGLEYSKTLEAWLQKFDENRSSIDAILQETYGAQQLTTWRSRWRVFLMACSELFAYQGGDTWFVCHYLLSPSKK